MRVCDICRNNGVGYGCFAIFDENGNGKNLELCDTCYHKLRQKEHHYSYLAYKETVEEITGESPKRKFWPSIFKR